MFWGKILKSCNSLSVDPDGFQIEGTGRSLPIHRNAASHELAHEICHCLMSRHGWAAPKYRVNLRSARHDLDVPVNLFFRHDGGWL
jgi:hypothetical protein